jgi:hypothetical protein
MVLSIESGIANTYALGVCCYVVCAMMMVVSRQPNRQGVPAARPVDDLGSLRAGEAIRGTFAVAPSIQPAQTELVADIESGKPLESTVPPAMPARAD